MSAKTPDLVASRGGLIQAGTSFSCIPIIVQSSVFFALDVSNIRSDSIQANLYSDSDFYYSNDGSVSIDPVVFSGSGLNDAIAGGTYSGSATLEYKIVLDATGTPDTFEWFKNGVSQASGVAITGAAQTLDNGVTVTFPATTGHTLNDTWYIQARVNQNKTSNVNLDIVDVDTIYIKGSASNQEIYITLNNAK